MKGKYFLGKVFGIVLMGLVLSFSGQLKAENTPAFPGAEGFGRYTTGGRGGTVYHVTSTADDNSAGTLRWALGKSEKRTIVFDVSGTIHLTSALKVQNGNVTIAGQTAPGDGICIADYPFSINSSNVIIRFVRFRLGNLNVAFHEGDGLGAMDQQDIIVDHCSISWSIDECCSILGNKNSTLQWCIVSQSLRNSGHAKGAHGYGGNWGGSGASFHHNLMCHHDSRTPRLGPRVSTQTDERMDMRNNVIYNWAGNGCYGGEGQNVNIVNNYYKPGPGTKQKSASIQYRIAKIGIRTTSYCQTYPAYSPMLHIWGDFYVDGNYVDGHSDVTSDNWTKGIYAQTSSSSENDYTFTSTTKDTIKMYSPLDYFYTTTHTAEVAYSKVLDYAGACYSRDWVDDLMVSDTRNGVATNTGSGSGDVYGIIDSQEDNKPANAPSNWSAWPILESTATPTDTDRDGMPDAWETANSLDPNSSADGIVTNENGYTNLELYMNSLVAPIMDAGIADGTLTGSPYPADNNGATVVSLSKSTYTGVASAASPWRFNGGYSVENSNTKTYATGSENGVKYSSGVQFTVTLPDGIQVESVKFTGYDNYADVDSYISELNGTSFDATKYVFTQKDANGDYILCENTISLASPVTDSFTFTIEGKQTVLFIDLTVASATGVSSLYAPLVDPNGLLNVYGIDGRIVKYQVSRNSASHNLPNGIYVIDGKKIAIFR